MIFLLVSITNLLSKRIRVKFGIKSCRYKKEIGVYFCTALFRVHFTRLKFEVWLYHIFMCPVGNWNHFFYQTEIIKKRGSFVVTGGSVYTRVSSNLASYNSTLDFQFTERIRDFDCPGDRRRTPFALFLYFHSLFYTIGLRSFSLTVKSLSSSSFSTCKSLAVRQRMVETNCAFVHQMHQEKQVPHERVNTNLIIFEKNYLPFYRLNCRLSNLYLSSKHKKRK